MSLTALAAGALAAASATTIALAAVPRPLRLRLLAPHPPISPASRGRLARAGAAIRRHGRIAASPLSDRALAGCAALVVVTLFLAPPLAGLVAVAVWAHAHVSARRDIRTRARSVAEGLPDSVDLLLLCVGAGLSLPLAHPLVATRTPGPLGEALAAAAQATDAGRPRADALLEGLAPLGDRALALSHVLTDHLRYGTPLVPGLERLGLELRLDRRRRAEEAARRVPVRLLLPLVTCVLPAFALLTVVPLLVASLQALPAG